MGITFNPLLLMGFDKTGSGGGGGGGGTIGGTVTGGTDKSVLFVDGTSLGQDPTDFNYDKTSNQLTVSGSILSPSIDSTGTTLTIGGTTATTINIGHSGVTVNIIGSTTYEQVTNLQVADKLMTINKGGAAGSASGTGFELEENNLITGYVKTSGDRNSWLLKAPNTAGDVTLTPGAGGITINQSSHDPATLTAVGASPNANGASLSTQALTLQPADGTNPGLLTAGAQTIGGNKTFTGSISASNISGTNTGDVTIGTANGLSIVGQVLSMALANGSVTGTLSATDYNTFNNKQPAGNYITDLTGDVTATGPGSVAATLATVNGNVGSFGSSTSIPSFTVNAKGLITAASSNVVIAPAGTLTGTTLASNVVSSSLTSVGTIASGTWQGTTIAVGFGGTGLNSTPTNGQLLIGNGTNYTLSTLTAGTGISITNGSGSITINATSFGSAGDINETSFTAADNQSSAADVTGFLFSNAVVRSFEALVSIVRNTTYAVYQLRAIQKAASWEMSQDFTGDTTGLTFSITSAGQVQYTSTSTGSTALVKFRAITTSVA